MNWGYCRIFIILLFHYYFYYFLLFYLVIIILCYLLTRMWIILLYIIHKCTSKLIFSSLLYINMCRHFMKKRLSIKTVFYICEAPPFKTSLSFYSLLCDSVSIKKHSIFLSWPTHIPRSYIFNQNVFTIFYWLCCYSSDFSLFAPLHPALHTPSGHPPFIVHVHGSGI